MQIKKLLSRTVLIVVASLAGSAIAAPVSVSFLGEVTYAGPLSTTLGAPVSGSFAYDSSTAPSITFGDTSLYEIFSPNALSATFSGHTVTSGLAIIYVTNGDGITGGDGFEIDAVQTTIDGVYYPDGVFAMVMSSPPGRPDVFATGSLPTTLDVKSFANNYGLLQANGGPNGQLMQFAIISTAVPEPSSYALLALGLLFVTGTYRRRTRGA